MAKYMSEEDQLISQRSAEEGDRLAAFLRQKAAENAKVAQAARQKQEFEQMTQDPRFKDLPITVGEYHLGGKPVDPMQELKLFQAKQDITQRMEKGKTMPLPAGEAEKIGTANYAAKAVSDSLAQHAGLGDVTGPVKGRITSFIKGQTDPIRAFKATKSQNAQIVGSYLEGGKLTDKDVPRYEAMLPDISDSPEVAKQKAEHLRDAIALRQKEQVSAMSAAGYRAKELPTIGVQQKPAMQNPDAEAIAWAKANSNDPRAQKILQMHGVK